MRTVLFIAAALLSFSLHAAEQPDWKNIDREALYERSLEANVHCDQDWVLPYADTLEGYGKYIGEERFVLFAVELRSFYAFAHNDGETYLECARILKEGALRLGDNEDYFRTMTNLIVFYLNDDRNYEASKTAQELIDHASVVNDPDGMAYGYFSLGNIYSVRGLRRLSNEKYEKCLEFLENATDVISLKKSSIYYAIAENCYNDRDEAGALDYLDKSLADNPNNPLSNILLAKIYFNRGDIPATNKWIENLRKCEEDPTNGIDYAYAEYHAEFYESLIHKNYAQALEMSDISEDLMEKYSFKIDAFKYMDKWDSAFFYQDLLVALTDSLVQTINQEETVMMNRELDEAYENALKDARIHRQRNLIVMFSTIILFVILISVLSFWGNVRLSKLRRQLEVANGKLAAAKEKAENDSKMKSYFVQNMSHDVRTPINAIVGFSQLLGLPDGMLSEEEKAEYNTYIGNNAEMLMMLVEDVLNMSDVEAGIYKIEMKEAGCNEICNTAIKCTDMRVQPGVNMYYTSEVDDDYKVYTDPRRCVQILINYLTNACKHTMQGEIHVHCSLSENPGRVTFSVTDTGDGVPEDFRTNLFERYSRLDVNDSHGIGLNICITLANKLGAEVKLDSTYTDGARFLLIV